MPSYFIAVLITCVVWLILFILRKDTRKEMLVIGLLLTPFVILDVLTVPIYWKPVTMFNIPVGIEGFLFTFFILGIASTVYQIVMKKKYKCKKINISFTYIFLIPLLISGIAVYFLKLNIIYLFILGFLFMAITQVIRRKDLLANALISALLFALVYIFAFTIWIYLSPESISWWNTSQLSNVHLGVIPLEEVLFSLSMGFFVGPLYEYMTQAKVG